MKRDDEINAERWAYTRAVAPFFDRAVEVYLAACEAKASAFAEMIKVDATNLSKMRAGERIIDVHHWTPLRRHPATKRYAVQAEAAACGVGVVVRAAVKLSAADVDRAIVEEVLRDSTLREIVLPRVSNRLGVTIGDVEDVIEHGDSPGADEGYQHAPVGP